MTPYNERFLAQKEFSNPHILDKVIDEFSLDEIGSNYPRDMYNPHGKDPSDFYEEIAKRQTELLYQ
jgi:hypothetical protein